MTTRATTEVGTYWSRVWQPVLDEIAAAGLRPVAVDFPGFGVRSKGGPPVDSQTVFQIGSTTKAFLATTMAIAVDRGKLRWDDRVIDLDPNFQLKDPWATREFRVFDLMAQRSGLPPYANDMLGLLGFDESAMIRSLRYVEPVSSFPHNLCLYEHDPSRRWPYCRHALKAQLIGMWYSVSELLDPLGMTKLLVHRRGNRSQSKSRERVSVYGQRQRTSAFRANASLRCRRCPPAILIRIFDDMAHWVRLHVGNGSFEGRRIVSPENLAYTRLTKVAVEDKVSYAMGWYVARTRNGSIVWHDGDTITAPALSSACCRTGMSG